MVRGAKLSTEAVRSTFMQYGYRPSNNFEYRRYDTKIRVLNEVHNRYEDMSYRTLLNRIKRGSAVPVDPFLHWLHNPLPVMQDPIEEAGQPHNQLGYRTRLQNYTNNYVKNTGYDKFATESPHVRMLTMRKAADYKQKALPNRHQNITVYRSQDEDDNRSAIYALIDTMYAIADSVYKRYRVSLAIWNSNDVFDFPSYYNIGEESIARLKTLMAVVFYGEEQGNVSDSEKMLITDLHNWTSLELIFDKLDDKEISLNELDEPAQAKGRRRAGAKWRWLNTTTIDLSSLGIFNEFDPNNYRYPCFVWALEQSGVLTAAEMDYVKGVLNTRSFPVDHIRVLCNKLGIRIGVSFYSNKDKQLHSPEFFGVDSADRTIMLILMHGHYMLNKRFQMCPQYIANYKHIEANINKESASYDKRFCCRKLNDRGYPTLVYDKNKQLMTMSTMEVINQFFRLGYFKRLSNRQLHQTKILRRDVNFVDLTYPSDACCRLKMERKSRRAYGAKRHMFVPNIDELVKSNPSMVVSRYKGVIRSAMDDTTIYKNPRIWFTFNDPTTDEIDMVRRLIYDRFGLSFDDYNSAADLGQALMFKYGCFDNVYELSGKPAQFISQCSPKITVKPAFNQAQDVCGDLVSLDKNGSYTSVYRDFEGIPMGKPKVIPVGVADSELQRYSDYYLYINVNSLKCRHEDRFPLITHLGANFVSKTTLANIKAHYDIDYTIISGYYFDEGFNKNIAKLAIDLYDIREELKSKGSRMDSLFKSVLNTLWGKCVYKQKLTEVKIKDIALKEFHINKHSDYIYNMRQLNEKYVQYTLWRPLSLEYGVPQFTANVLSYSRAFMSDVYFTAADKGFPIYYSNTDCVLMHREDAERMGIIGDHLGQFKIEYEGIERAIIISGKRFLWLFNDGSSRCILHGTKPATVDEQIRYFSWVFNHVDR